MADDVQDISDYRDAIESMLLSGEELEATFPARVDQSSESDEPKVVAVTSHRLIVCHRNFKRSAHDHWTFQTIPFPRILDLHFYRFENFRRDRIDARSHVHVSHGQQVLVLTYTDVSMAREVHNRILAHMLAV